MDAHWRGAIVVAHALREAGMEVIYLGHATPPQLAATVVQEDADLLGLSSLSGNHLTECRAVVDELRRAGSDDLTVVVGGTIPVADGPLLAAIGIDAVFGVGTPLRVIVERVAGLLSARSAI